MGNMSPNHTPLRIGVLLPFGNPNSATRGLANTMMKAAELALFDTGARDMVLMTADEGAGGDTAVAGTQKLLDQGAEIIIGPLFAGSVRSVARLTRDRAVPLLSFSTDRTVAGDGVYLLSFQPEDLVRRVLTFASATGHKNFAAMVQNTAYGQVVEKAFGQVVPALGGKVSDVEHIADPAAPAAQAAAVAKSDADAILIGQGGAAVTTTGIALRGAGVDPARVKLLGAGSLDDAAVQHEPSLQGAWFAAPPPGADAAYVAKYKATFGANPPPLSAVAYDAVTLIAALSGGAPYHRFTPQALTDPNGFAGVNGIFRFHGDGTIERGLAVMSVTPTGSAIVDPAPRTFEKPVG